MAMEPYLVVEGYVSSCDGKLTRRASIQMVVGSKMSPRSAGQLTDVKLGT